MLGWLLAAFIVVGLGICLVAGIAVGLFGSGGVGPVIHAIWGLVVLAFFWLIWIICRGAYGMVARAIERRRDG